MKNNFNFNKYTNYLSEIEKNSQKKLLNSNGGKICWRSWGKGTPLILLHGGYGSWKHWIKQAIPFSKNFNVLIPDMPGFGESDDLTLPHTPEKIASNLADTLIKIILIYRSQQLEIFHMMYAYLIHLVSVELMHA